MIKQLDLSFDFKVIWAIKSMSVSLHSPSLKNAQAEWNEKKGQKSSDAFLPCKDLNDFACINNICRIS